MEGRATEFGVRSGTDYDQESGGDETVKIFSLTQPTHFWSFLICSRWTCSEEDTQRVLVQIKDASIGDVTSMQWHVSKRIFEWIKLWMLKKLFVLGKQNKKALRKNNCNWTFNQKAPFSTYLTNFHKSCKINPQENTELKNYIHECSDCN